MTNGFSKELTCILIHVFQIAVIEWGTRKCVPRKIACESVDSPHAILRSTVSLPSPISVIFAYLIIKNNLTNFISSKTVNLFQDEIQPLAQVFRLVPLNHSKDIM